MKRIATIAVFSTLLLGTFVFSYVLGMRLEIDLLKVNYLALGLSVLLGVASLISLGFLLSGINLLSTKLQFTLSEYVSGIFFLLGDVIFPPSMLPSPLNLLSSALPITYYIRAVRASVLSGAWDAILPNMAMLLLLAMIITVAGLLGFGAAEKRAKRLGILDRKSEY
jgi:ABC-2 type transport system permease protein